MHTPSTLSLLFSSAWALALLVCLVPQVDAHASSHSNRGFHFDFPMNRLCPNSQDRARAPKCCVWYQIKRDLVNKVYLNRCQDNARASIRLAFHDASGFSQILKKNGQPFGGGTDGSILKFPEELTRPENVGLARIVGLLKPIADKYSVSYGDMVQFASSVALTQCAGAPLVPFFAGRPSPLAASPPGMIMGPSDPLPSIIARFADLGLTSWEMVALTGAHTVAAQGDADPGEVEDVVDESENGPDEDGNPRRFHLHGLGLRGRLFGRDGVEARDIVTPFDSTISTFDTQFFIDTMATNPPNGTMRLDSDVAMSTNPATACIFQRYAGNQRAFNIDFRNSMIKMSLIGQLTANVQQFTDCSEALPPRKRLRKAVRYPAGGATGFRMSCRKGGVVVPPAPGTAPGSGFGST